MARQMELVRFLYIFLFVVFFSFNFNSIRIFYLFTFDLKQSFVCSLFVVRSAGLWGPAKTVLRSF